MGRLIGALAILAAFAGTSAWAQPAPAAVTQKAFTVLIGLGYDIKATATAPGKDSAGKDITTVFVTLQLGKSVAVCTFSTGVWSNMTDTEMENPRFCDVRSY
ncbi:MAG: hypothetical protein U1E56_01570 [Bauldia sp.]